MILTFGKTNRGHPGAGQAPRNRALADGAVGGHAFR
jgi:hypothetical protein